MARRPRTELQSRLEEIVPNVYFQPPPNYKMTYPCIRYSRSRILPTFADNKPYIERTRYTLYLIDKNPDSIYLDAIAALPYCTHTRNYVADNLNHDVFEIEW